METLSTQNCGGCKQNLPSSKFAPCHQGRNGFYCHDCRRKSWTKINYDPRYCKQCGEQFTPSQVTALYCGPACRNIVKKTRVIEKKKLAIAAVKAGKTCQGCDIDIAHMYSNAKWCSNQCRIKSRTPEQRRAYRLSSKYGIKPEHYDEMVTQQNNTCAICKSPDPKTEHGFWHIDHCHETGRIRGLLCSTCNTGIGQFFDNPDLLIAAARYLNKT